MIKNAENILITGASSGIGRALAVYYARNGAKNLFICGRNFERLTEVQNECLQYGASIYPCVIDVTNRSAVKNWISMCNQTAPLHLVIANAGVATLQETDENIYNTFNTNINGVVNSVLPAIEIYRSRDKSEDKRKAIAIISSIAGLSRTAELPLVQRLQSLRQSLGRSAARRLAP